jgi:hypothetical protein
MFSQRNLQGGENLHSGTEVCVIRLSSTVAALPNTAKRFSPMQSIFRSARSDSRLKQIGNLIGAAPVT